MPLPPLISYLMTRHAILKTRWSSGLHDLSWQHICLAVSTQMIHIALSLSIICCNKFLFLALFKLLPWHKVIEWQRLHRHPLWLYNHSFIKISGTRGWAELKHWYCGNIPKAELISHLQSSIYGFAPKLSFWDQSKESWIKTPSPRPTTQGTIWLCHVSSQQPWISSSLSS